MARLLEVRRELRSPETFRLGTKEMSEINGLEQLKRVPGYNSSFNKAEIIRIFMDRRIPSMTMLLLVPEFNKTGNYLTSEVTLEFNRIERFHLEAFNHQNVVSSLSFEEVVHASETRFIEEARISVIIDASFGALAEFTCTTIGVVSVNEIVVKIGNP